MSIAKDIMTELVNDISFADGVYQVDAEPKQAENGDWYLDIDTDDGDGYRLTLSLVPESPDQDAAHESGEGEL